MEDFDIYGDLEHIENESKQEDEVLRALRQKIKELEENAEIVEREKKDIMRQNKILLENVSSLLLTAKAELKRKDTVISDLRRQSDNSVFKRGASRYNKDVRCVSKFTQTPHVHLVDMEVQTVHIQEGETPPRKRKLSSSVMFGNDMRQTRDRYHEEDRAYKTDPYRESHRNRGRTSEREYEREKSRDRERERVRSRDREREKHRNLERSSECDRRRDRDKDRERNRKSCHRERSRDRSRHKYERSSDKAMRDQSDKRDSKQERCRRRSNERSKDRELFVADANTREKESIKEKCSVSRTHVKSKRLENSPESKLGMQEIKSKGQPEVRLNDPVLPSLVQPSGKVHNRDKGISTHYKNQHIDDIHCLLSMSEHGRNSREPTFPCISGMPDGSSAPHSIHESIGVELREGAELVAQQKTYSETRQQRIISDGITQNESNEQMADKILETNVEEAISDQSIPNISPSTGTLRVTSDEKSAAKGAKSARMKPVQIQPSDDLKRDKQPTNADETLEDKHVDADAVHKERSPFSSISVGQVFETIESIHASTSCPLEENANDTTVPSVESSSESIPCIERENGEIISSIDRGKFHLNSDYVDTSFVKEKTSSSRKWLKTRIAGERIETDSLKVEETVKVIVDETVPESTDSTNIKDSKRVPREQCKRKTKSKTKKNHAPSDSDGKTHNRNLDSVEQQHPVSIELVNEEAAESGSIAKLEKLEPIEQRTDGNNTLPNFSIITEQIGTHVPPVESGKFEGTIPKESPSAAIESNNAPSVTCSSMPEGIENNSHIPACSVQDDAGGSDNQPGSRVLRNRRSKSCFLTVPNDSYISLQEFFMSFNADSENNDNDVEESVDRSTTVIPTEVIESLAEHTEPVEGESNKAPSVKPKVDPLEALRARLQKKNNTKMLNAQIESITSANNSSSGAPFTRYAKRRLSIDSAAASPKRNKLDSARNHGSSKRPVTHNLSSTYFSQIALPITSPLDTIQPKPIASCNERAKDMSKHMTPMVVVHSPAKPSQYTPQGTPYKDPPISHYAMDDRASVQHIMESLFQTPVKHEPLDSAAASRTNNVFQKTVSSEGTPIWRTSEGSEKKGTAVADCILSNNLLAYSTPLSTKPSSRFCTDRTAPVKNPSEEEVQCKTSAHMSVTDEATVAQPEKRTSVKKSERKTKALVDQGIASTDSNELKVKHCSKKTSTRKTKNDDVPPIDQPIISTTIPNGAENEATVQPRTITPSEGNISCGALKPNAFKTPEALKSYKKSEKASRKQSLDELRHAVDSPPTNEISIVKNPNEKENKSTRIKWSAHQNSSSTIITQSVTDKRLNECPTSLSNTSRKRSSRRTNNDEEKHPCVSDKTTSPRTLHTSQVRNKENAIDRPPASTIDIVSQQLPLLHSNNTSEVVSIHGFRENNAIPERVPEPNNLVHMGSSVQVKQSLPPREAIANSSDGHITTVAVRESIVRADETCQQVLTCLKLDLSQTDTKSANHNETTSRCDSSLHYVREMHVIKESPSIMRVYVKRK